MRFAFVDGATAIDPDEAQGLIPSLSTQAELNEFELLNIAEAADWAERSRRIKSDLVNPEALKELHRRMFGRTWRWAGTFRITQKSIGIEAYRIPTELLSLTQDVKYWLEFHSYEPDEIAARFHHRLVLIHPFPNGNGRHARLAADLLCRQHGWSLFTWGAANLAAQGDMRDRYLATLRQADAGDITPLIRFCRS